MSVNVTVRLRPDESQEKFLKRFIKKVKKENIVKEYLEKTSFYRTESEKRKSKRIKNWFLKQKDLQK